VTAHRFECGRPLLSLESEAAYNDMSAPSAARDLVEVGTAHEIDRIGLPNLVTLSQN
jgi:hypothetical protein